MPLIDYIDGNKFTMEPQQGGDEDGLARGAWDWSLLWKRVPLSQREKAQRKHTTLPYRYTFFWSMLTFIPVLFVSPSLSPNPTSALSRLAPTVLSCMRITCPPPCIVCMGPPSPLGQNGVYGASHRLH